MSIRQFEEHLPKISDTAYVDDASVVIGRVSLADDVGIWPMAVLRGDIHDISVGRGTNIQDGTIIHVTHQGEFSNGNPTVIGEYNTIGHQAMLHACRIENYCLIGMNAIVLDGAVIPDRTMVGAGSLVPPGKQLESGYLYVGSPVKRVRKLTDKELAFLEYSANYYIELKNRHGA